jgi:hypothetical protein
MTLVLSCATPEYIVQVSDRHLTWPNGQLADDNTNKVVLFCRRVAFAYTGLAEIDGEKTDEWLMDVLATSNSLSEARSAIESSATKAFQRIPLPNSQKRHAFVGVGWTLLTPEDQPRAIICSISNAQNDRGEWLSEARDSFSQRCMILPELNLCWLEDAGYRLKISEKRELEHQIKDCVEHKTGPKPIARLLMRAVRQVADRSERVGHNLLVVSLPKNAVSFESGEFIVLNAPPHRGNLTFLYVAAGKYDGVQYGPVLAGCGPQFRDWRASSGLTR